MLDFIDIHTGLMQIREAGLHTALAGLQLTNLHLVSISAAALKSSNPLSHVFPSGVSDDSGIYYFIPLLAILFHLTVSASFKLFIFIAGSLTAL